MNEAELALQALSSGGDSGVAQVQSARRVLVAGSHVVIVLLVQELLGSTGRDGARVSLLERGAVTLDEMNTI